MIDAFDFLVGLLAVLGVLAGAVTALLVSREAVRSRKARRAALERLKAVDVDHLERLIATPDRSARVRFLEELLGDLTVSDYAVEGELRTRLRETLDRMAAASRRPPAAA